jgi:hypothetical protein
VTTPQVLLVPFSLAHGPVLQRVHAHIYECLSGYTGFPDRRGTWWCPKGMTRSTAQGLPDPIHHKLACTYVHPLCELEATSAATTTGCTLLYTSTMAWWQVSEACPCTDKSSMPKPGQGATLHVTATYTLRYKNKCLCFICIYKRAKICIDIYLILDKSPAPLLRNVGNTCMLMLPWEENNM